MSVVIKVCGVRRAEDVDACVEAGVDAVGFNLFSGSKRFISAADAQPLVKRLPSHVLPVGVFVNAPVEEVRRAVETAGLRAIQLHGEEDPMRFAALAAQRFQVIRVQAGVALPDAVSPAATWVLLDAWVEAFGGAGHTFDWERVREARRHGVPLMVAGGITPENVESLLSRARPDGIDVASGVERSPGMKDPALIRALVQAVRQWEAVEEKSV